MRQISNNRYLNFLMFDFIEFDPCMLSFILGLNYKIDLEVKKAVIEVEDDNHHIVKSFDVTKRLNSIVCRRNSLWIVDWERDAGVKLKFGWLNIQIEID